MKLDDPNSPEYQRMRWDALRKSINGHINKVNVGNIKHIIPEVFFFLPFSPCSLKVADAVRFRSCSAKT